MAWTALNTAAFAPMPRASVSTAMPVNPQSFRNSRPRYRRFSQKPVRGRDRRPWGWPVCGGTGEVTPSDAPADPARRTQRAPAGGPPRERRQWRAVPDDGRRGAPIASSMISISRVGEKRSPAKCGRRCAAQSGCSSPLTRRTPSTQASAPGVEAMISVIDRPYANKSLLSTAAGRLSSSSWVEGRRTCRGATGSIRLRPRANRHEAGVADRGQSQCAMDRSDPGLRRGGEEGRRSVPVTMMQNSGHFDGLNPKAPAWQTVMTSIRSIIGTK